MVSLRHLPFFVPWPEESPGEPESKITGWPDRTTVDMFDALLHRDTKIAVEIGCWCGASAKMILERIDGILIAIDVFDINQVPEECSPKHLGFLQKQEAAETFFSRFRANLWEYRDRVFPLACTSQEGIAVVKSLGEEFCKQVDFVYIDADHRPEMARDDLQACIDAFPNAVYTGDDWQVVQKGIRQVVTEGVKSNGKSWWWCPA